MSSEESFPDLYRVTSRIEAILASVFCKLRTHYKTFVSSTPGPGSYLAFINPSLKNVMENAEKHSTCGNMVKH